MRNPRAVLGIVGGSGLYDLPGLSGVRREKVRTPFGDPSDTVVLGRLGEQEGSAECDNGEKRDPEDDRVHGFFSLPGVRLGS